MKTYWLWWGIGALLLALAGAEAVTSHCEEEACPAPPALLRTELSALPRSGNVAPIVDLPVALRTSNWGGGSCVHASTVHLLYWQGQPELAQWWRQTYSGGEHASRLHERLNQAHLQFAYTVEGDVAFLEWALRTRRGAGITYFPNHAVNLVHLDEQRAGLLDNNRVQQIVWIERQEFLARWRAYGGWAWTLVYNPPPPLPFVD
jgi:hypothetical protein